MTDATITPEKREAIQRGVELLTRDRDCMVECNSNIERAGDEFKPVPGTLDPDCEDDFRDYNAAIEAIPALLSALEAQAAELAEVRQQYVDANEARIDAEAQLAEARQTVALFEHYGCPICHGDCAAANPPVDCCPMEAARRIREGGSNG